MIRRPPRSTLGSNRRQRQMCIRDSLSDELIKVIKRNDNICKYFHLPLQSGSDKVLKDMNRKYTQEKYLERARKLKEEIPEIAISTDIIVGYPTETEEDFEQTLKVCKEVGYDTAFTFKYSPRPKTRAAKLTPIDDDIVLSLIHI